MADESELTAEELEEQIEEEHMIWKKNSPFLYDVVVTHELEWPSLTVQWFPDKVSQPGKPYSLQRLLLGTNTSGQDDEYLMIASVQLPNEDAEIDARKHADGEADEEEVGGFGHGGAKITISQKINVEAEVNRARYMPQNPDVLACHTAMPDILIFDRTRHPSEPKNRQCSPQLRLKGHSKEGFGLAWSPLVEGRLVSGASDFIVNLYDVNAAPKEATSLDPLAVFRGHKNTINDVAFSCHEPHVFASVGDDGKILFWDARAAGSSSSSTEATTNPTLSIDSPGGADVLCLSFNPFQEHLFATGGAADNAVHLWDRRKIGAPVHAFLSHQDQVLSLHWAPFDEAILASGSADRRVCVWDTSRIGNEQDPEDAEDGPPELLVIDLFIYLIYQFEAF
jgi:histone-binding protein RBBP4